MAFGAGLHPGHGTVEDPKAGDQYLQLYTTPLPPSTPQLKAESWSPGVSRAGLIARLWQKHSAEQSCPQLERVATAELASCQPPSPTYLTHSLGPREELRAVEFCSHLEDRCALGPLPVFRLRKPRFLEVQGVPGSLYPAPPVL